MRCSHDDQAIEAYILENYTPMEDEWKTCVVCLNDMLTQIVGERDSLYAKLEEYECPSPDGFFPCSSCDNRVDQCTCHEEE